MELIDKGDKMSVQKQLEVSAAVRQWAGMFMQQNQIDPITMANALTEVLSSVKDEIVYQLLIEVQQKQQENLSQEIPQEEVEDDSSIQ